MPGNSFPTFPTPVWPGEPSTMHAYVHRTPRPQIAPCVQSLRNAQTISFFTFIPTAPCCTSSAGATTPQACQERCHKPCRCSGIRVQLHASTPMAISSAIPTPWPLPTAPHTRLPPSRCSATKPTHCLLRNAHLAPDNNGELIGTLQLNEVQQLHGSAHAPTLNGEPHV